MVELTIYCDGCSMLGDASSKSAREARRQLREFGWRTSLPGGRDLCPECAEQDAVAENLRKLR